MKKLQKYLKTNKVKPLAQLLGVTQVTVYNWKKGATIPSVRQAILIDRLTKGQVDVYSWL